MTAADTYLARAIAILEVIAATQRDPIEAASQRVAGAIGDGGRVWVAATSHVLHTELFLRAGGLAAVHPLGETPDLAQPMLHLSGDVLRGDGAFRPARGDVAIVGTNAGTDAGTVQVAMAARAAGCTVIGLTCVAYERWPDVVVEHPSGAKLVDLADVVVDIGGVDRRRDRRAARPRHAGRSRPPGSPCAPPPGRSSSARPSGSSTAGLIPIVYRSVQIPGAETLFHERMARYEATRRGWEPAPGPRSDGRRG